MNFMQSILFSHNLSLIVVWFSGFQCNYSFYLIKAIFSYYYYFINNISALSSFFRLFVTIITMKTFQTKDTGSTFLLDLGTKIILLYFRYNSYYTFLILFSDQAKKFKNIA